eukprot:GEMP01120077.1.p1 GENE.GEMP01120077.1~~GEMP01120077.1.p1  ORF type:complete len:187 (-),score=45.75 GEMP01120077.1:30-590(-)
MTRQPLCFVTGNKKKLEEVSRLFGREFDSAPLDLPEYQGDPADIARSKCQLAFDMLKKPVLTEDTSLCYTALGELPGPYVKWFLLKIGQEGLYKLLDAYEDKSAFAQTIFAYMDDTLKEPQIFAGRTSGKIVFPRGDGNFGKGGWDPVFQPDGFEITYAEMTSEEKGKISHRSKALDLVKEYLAKN